MTYLIELIVIKCDSVQDQKMGGKRDLEAAYESGGQFCLTRSHDRREDRQGHIAPLISWIFARTGSESQQKQQALGHVVTAVVAGHDAAPDLRSPLLSRCRTGLLMGQQVRVGKRSSGISDQEVEQRSGQQTEEEKKESF